ncbi:MAG TPA: hypothetical protein VKG80_20850 [Trebonia sp.]|nr:hypothetical protein [Trebonia sp.]
MAFSVTAGLAAAQGDGVGSVHEAQVCRRTGLVPDDRQDMILLDELLDLPTRR